MSTSLDTLAMRERLIEYEKKGLQEIKEHARIVEAEPKINPHISGWEILFPEIYQGESTNLSGEYLIELVKSVDWANGQVSQFARDSLDYYLLQQISDKMHHSFPVLSSPIRIEYKILALHNHLECPRLAKFMRLDCQYITLPRQLSEDYSWDSKGFGKFEFGYHLIPKDGKIIPKFYFGAQGGPPCWPKGFLMERLNQLNS